MPIELTEGDVAAFRREGQLVVRAFYTPAEMAVLAATLAADRALSTRALRADDGHGGATEIALWNFPGDDAFGALARGARLVDAAGALLGGEVYHYHSKITAKRPGGGGTWVWHQDYGYWYGNGCLLPDMLTVAIPLDSMSAANGCLQVLTGSHRMGRIDHGPVGAQTGADPARVQAARGRFPQTPFEGEPGDVMFFHANTLHTSAPNLSGSPRTLLLVAFNTRANDPVREHHHPCYTPLEVLADDELLGRAGRVEGDRRVFLIEGSDAVVPRGATR